MKKKVLRRVRREPPAPATKSVATRSAAKKRKRKLSKKQIIVERHRPENLGKTTSGYMRAMMSDIQKETGDLSFCTPKDAGKLMVGIPLPSFCGEYLILNSVLPLERMLQIFGPPKIGKSGLAFEVHRWFKKLGGNGNIQEHETKVNEDWLQSIIGWDDESTGIIRCDNIEDWQTRLQKCTAWTKARMTGTKQNPGGGRVYPYLNIVDSIMGKLTRESQEKIRSQGYAGRSHAIEAMSITYFLKTYPQDMRGWPFGLVTVNHLKKKIGETVGPHETSRAGGAQVDFQGSFAWKVQRISKIRTASLNGNKLRITCEHNSYGEDGRQIVVDCVWWDERDEVTGEMRQKTIFDWHGATVRLLLDLEGAKGTVARDVCGLVKSKCSKSRAFSTKVDMHGEADLPYHAVGVQICENEEMMKDLRDLFAVRKRKEFVPSVDYRKQVAAAKQVAYEES